MLPCSYFYALIFYRCFANYPLHVPVRNILYFFYLRQQRKLIQTLAIEQRFIECQFDDCTFLPRVSKLLTRLITRLDFIK